MDEGETSVLTVLTSLADIYLLILSQALISRLRCSSKGASTLKTQAENCASRMEAF